MSGRLYNRQTAFTLVEIMIVVAIIGLLTVLAIPSFIKARKQSQGRRIMNDIRQMDAAIDQWALDAGKKDGNLSFYFIEKLAECFYRLRADYFIFVFYDKQGNTCQTNQLSFFSGLIQT